MSKKHERRDTLIDLIFGTYEPYHGKEKKERSHDRSRQDRPQKESNWREKSCPGVNGSYCGNTIKYRTDWDHIPDLCSSCKGKARSNRQQRPERQQRPRQDSNWREKTCKCGQTIRYRIDWNHIPDLCPSCIAAEKDKWREKPCPRCGKAIRYRTDWNRPPNFCKTCEAAHVHVSRGDKPGTLQAEQKHVVLFHFGRCSVPRGDRRGGDADRRREWATRGYWWVSMPGNPHETFILANEPVVDGFIQVNQHMDTSYSTDALRRAWAAMALAVIDLAE